MQCSDQINWVSQLQPKLYTNRVTQKLSQRTLLLQNVCSLSAFRNLNSQSNWKQCFSVRRGPYVSAEITMQRTCGAVELVVLLLACTSPNDVTINPVRFAEAIDCLSGYSMNCVNALAMRDLALDMRELVDTYTSTRKKLQLKDSCGSLALASAVVLCGMWTGATLMWRSVSHPGKFAALRAEFAKLTVPTKMTCEANGLCQEFRVPCADIEDMQACITLAATPYAMLHGQVSVEDMVGDVSIMEAQHAKPECHSRIIQKIMQLAWELFLMVEKDAGSAELLELYGRDSLCVSRRAVAAAQHVRQIAVTKPYTNKDELVVILSRTMRDLYGDIIMGTAGGFKNVLGTGMEPDISTYMGVLPLVGWLAGCATKHDDNVSCNVARVCAALRTTHLLDPQQTLGAIHDLCAPWVPKMLILTHMPQILQCAAVGSMVARFRFVVRCCNILQHHLNDTGIRRPAIVNLLELESINLYKSHIKLMSGVIDEIVKQSECMATGTIAPEYKTRLQSCIDTELLLARQAAALWIQALSQV